MNRLALRGFLHRAMVLVAVASVAMTVALARADDAPRTMIRAHLEPAGPIVAGTQVRLVVDVLTTTWLSDAPDWPLFDLPGAIVTLPDEQAHNVNEMIGDQRWFGVSRAYRIAPQTGRRYTIPSFAIHAQPGGATGPVTLMTPTLSFVATVPPGAEGMAVFFPTTHLTVSQRIDPLPSRLQVGDTITRTVTQRADATQAILIPPAPLGDVEGTQRYARPAETKDDLEGSRGLVAGIRTDSAMYVVNRAGHIELPAIDIEWWNTATQRREKTTLPAVSLSARGARETPLFEIPAEAVGRAAHRVIVLDRSDLWLTGAGMAALAALLWLWPRIANAVRGARQRFVAWRQAVRTGEPHAWRVLRRAARNRSWPAFVASLYGWLDRCAADHGAGRSGLADVDSPGIAPLRDAVYARYAAGDTPSPAATGPERGFMHCLTQVRRQMKRAAHRSSEADDLPPLYPPARSRRPGRRPPP
ncbi:hypothetical protein [Pandoraea pnomenusa]|uniref:hypothetical protein n=1 Tax=Pandoraea pnomenusa TaxID=93220 RepID=UPI003341B11D